MTTLISVLAIVIASVSLFVSAEKFRLDLYNKRFDIYMRTVKFYQALMHEQDGTFAALRADFIVASRESRFLFSPESGVHELLSQLSSASFTIIGMHSLPKGLPPEQIMENQKKFLDALILWNSSIEKLEDLMAPDLNYHYAFPPSDRLSWMRRRMRKYKTPS
jgi:hypothetical protein